MIEMGARDDGRKRSLQGQKTGGALRPVDLQPGGGIHGVQEIALDREVRLAVVIHIPIEGVAVVTGQLRQPGERADDTAREQLVERDRVRRRVRIGLLDAPPQATRSGVIEVQDGIGCCPGGEQQSQRQPNQTRSHRSLPPMSVH
jgi:hypothetical protein